MAQSELSAPEKSDKAPPVRAGSSRRGSEPRQGEEGPIPAVRETGANMERGKDKINPVILDWNWRYWCGFVIFLVVDGWMDG